MGNLKAEIKDLLLTQPSFQDVLAEIRFRNLNFNSPDLQGLRAAILKHRLITGDLVETGETGNFISALQLNPTRPTNFEILTATQIVHCCLAEIAALLLLRELPPVDGKLTFLRQLLIGFDSGNEQYADIFATYHLYRAIHARLNAQYKAAQQAVEQVYKFNKSSRAAGLEAARIHLALHQDDQAMCLLVRQEKVFMEKPSDIPFQALCRSLMAKCDRGNRLKHLQSARELHDQSPYIPTAAHLHVLYDLAEEFGDIHSDRSGPPGLAQTEQLFRLLDEAANLCKQFPWLDQTGERAQRAAAYLVEANGCDQGAGDERLSDFLRQARNSALEAHGERTVDTMDPARGERLMRYLTLAYLVHGESETPSRWTKALRWLNNAAEFEQAMPQPDLHKRIETSRNVRMERLPLLSISPPEHTRGFNKACALLKEKYIVAYFPSCGKVRHMAQLMGITDEEAHNTIRDIEKKVAKGDTSEHIQQWREIYPQGYKRRS